MESIALAGVIISALAAIVTAWMAVETRRMAAVSNAALELERAPVLGFRDLKLEIGAKDLLPEKEATQPQSSILSVRAGVELFNAGRVPVQYTM
jgi:hypothetical protein